MNKTTLLILIGVGVFLLLVSFIVIAKLIGKKRAKKLQENIKKLNQEKESLNQEVQVVLAKDEPEVPQIQESENNEQKDNAPLIEDYIPDPVQEEVSPVSEEDNIFMGEEDDIQKKLDALINEMPKQKQESNTIKLDDDFESFMNEHSYSRKVFNKPLLEKIKKMPPDVRMLLLSNLFDRFDD